MIPSRSLDTQARAYQAAADESARDAAFEAILRGLKRDLEGIARTAARSVGRPDAAEDLCQEAFEAVLECLARFDASKGAFAHFALKQAKRVLDGRKRYVGRNPVMPDEDPLRLARLAQRAFEAYRQMHDRVPELREWREAMRQAALAEALANGASDPEAVVRRLNLNSVDPEQAVLDAGMGTVWLDQPLADGTERKDSHPLLARTTPEAEAPALSAALLTEVMVRAAVREGQRRRQARRRVKTGALAMSAQALRQAQVLRGLLLKQRTLLQASAELGLPVVTLRKWQGECLFDLRRWRKDAVRMEAFEAEARALAQTRAVEALAPEPSALTADAATPGLRQFALLCTLAACPQEGLPVQRLFESLAAHYVGSADARERMLKRDVEALRAQGWPVVSLYQGGGEPWYRLAAPAVALDPAFELESAEAKALQAALAGPGAAGLAPESRQALRRLLGLRGPLAVAAAEGSARSQWAVLLHAIEAGRACDLSWGKSAARQSVSPYAWISRGARTFVLLRIHAAAERGVQALDLGLLREARDTAAAFIPAPAGFNAQRWALEQGPWYAAAAKATVRLPADEAAWAGQRWPFVLRRAAAGGAEDFDFYVEDEAAFLDFVLREFGAAAQILETGAGKGLRRALAKRLGAAR